jgi:aminoglycoside phosphotransferase
MKLGASGGKLYELISPDKTSYVLKIVYVKNPYDSQEKEVAFYHWLEGKVKVPKIHYFEKRDDLLDIPVEILVMEKLQGDDLETLLEKYDRKIVLEAYGRFLKHLHLLPLDQCPIHIPIDQKIKQAKVMMDNGCVNDTNFEAQHKAFSSNDLFKRIVKEQPLFEVLVICHGDYCLDNIVGEYKDSKIQLSGFIDLGRGGIQDRYQDLALAIRSISREPSHEDLKVFLRAYGLITDLDHKKIDYYILMDEFF